VLKDYKLSRPADRDLEEIWDYTAAEWSVRQAKKYLEQIEKTLLRLVKDPGLGRARPDLETDLLFYRQGEHYIIYGYNETHLLVARILHVNRDIAAHLH
jgi:toxin ParE1/3/4